MSDKAKEGTVEPPADETGRKAKSKKSKPLNDSGRESSHDSRSPDGNQSTLFV